MVVFEDPRMFVLLQLQDIHDRLYEHYRLRCPLCARASVGLFLGHYMVAVLYVWSVDDRALIVPCLVQLLSG